MTNPTIENRRGTAMTLSSRNCPALVGESPSVTKGAAVEQHQDANLTCFTASENRDHGPETIAEASKPSNRK